MPGLIDLHAHFCGFKGFVLPDAHCLPTGVTAALDAGGSGWKTYDAFNDQVISKSTTRVFALLNIVGAGMVGDPEQDLEEMDPEAAVAKISQRPDRLVGIKVAHYQGPGWEPLDRGVEAAQATGTFVMVDQNALPTRTADKMLLEHLQPGDVTTHCFGFGKPVINAKGEVKSVRPRGEGTGHSVRRGTRRVAASHSGWPRRRWQAASRPTP